MNTDPLLALNSNNNLNFLATLDPQPEDNDIISPYTQYKINSLYFDTNSLIQKNRNHCQPLFMSLNCQSLSSKHTSIKTLMKELANSNVHIDILALQETWRLPYTDLIQIPGYHFTYKQRSTNRGGGVGFYIKNSISYKLHEDLSHFTDNVFESITIEAKIQKKTYLLTSIYRSPNPPHNMTNAAQITAFTSQLDALLSMLNTKKLNSYLFLDSNLNLLLSNTDSTISNYHDTILNNGYLQTITKATRIQDEHFSLIDHILSNTPSTNTQSGILVSDISDHFFTFTLPEYQKKREAPTSYTTRNFSDTNIENFRLALRNLTWDTTLGSNSVDESYTCFWADFKPIYDTHFPKITRKTNKNKQKICNFLTPELLAARRTKLELHKLYLATPTPENKATYTQHRNAYNTAVRKQKAQYYEQSLAASRNPKNTWSILKEAANLSKNTHRITEILANGTLTSNDTEIANAFNHFFSTAGSNIANSLPTSNKDPLSYIPELPDTARQLELEGCGQILVGNTIRQLVSKTSTDIDGISSKLIKAIQYEIEKPLAHIFRLSLASGTFPAQFKASRVIPIHKAGDTSNCDNYRPISLVNAFSKVLEKIVCTKLVNHLEQNKLIYNHQYGFLKGRSTEHALIHITNKIGQALNENKYCVGVFLDLKKAFDVVPHNILLKKLEKMGITGTALAWFNSYLSNRTQKVEINGHLSDSTSLDALSVFQGTSLGPVLFLCFINDLPRATDLFTVLYNDDTTGLDSDADLPTLMSRVSTELHKMADWFQSNKMALNVNKTKYIIFHVPSKKVEQNVSLHIDTNLPDTPHNPALVLEIERIHNTHANPTLRSFKLLGIYFDENLSFNQNTTALISKLSRSIFFLNRVKHTLTAKALKSLYTSFFHSHLLYCTNIYSCTSQTNLNKIYMQQKKAIRIITNSSYTAHTGPLFTRLHILPLEQIITQARLTFMHSIYYEYAPHSFTNTWQTHSQRNPDINLRNATDFEITFPRIELYKRLPIYSLPHTWNSHDTIRYYSNITTFRIALQELLHSHTQSTEQPV